MNHELTPSAEGHGPLPGRAQLGEIDSSTLRRIGPAVAGYALPFLLIVYLALKGGGYDPLVRGEIGIAIWWVILLGSAVGALSNHRIGRAGWIALSALIAFAAWTALGISWSESSERSVAELGRVTAYVGVFALALLAQGRAALQRTTRSVAAAVAVVGLLALLSRLVPEWFPANTAQEFFAESGRRLNYPLNYWNGLAALMAIGLPLLVWMATASRTVMARAVSAAVVPAICLTAFLTLSRGGAIEAVVAIGALVVLYPHRLALASTLLTTGLGSALVIAAAAQRGDFADGLSTSAAATQADEMLIIAIIVCVGTGLLQAALAQAEQSDMLRIPRLTRRTGVGLALGAAVVAVGAGLVMGAPGQLSDTWDEFKERSPGGGDTTARFESASGTGRYQIWESALDASSSEPLTGIGPGTFEFWWAREGTISIFVRDAHSLYLETAAELGIVGLVLLLAFVLTALGVGTSRALRAGPGPDRAAFAALTAGCLAFAVAAAIDWVWELPVIPIVFLILVATIVRPRTEGSNRPSGLGWRIGAVGLSLVAIAAIAIPMAGTSAVRASQTNVNSADLPGALDEARTARDIQPYAATAQLQEALVLEASGSLESAVVAAKAATRDEPTNWRTWLILSRLQARSGDVQGSIDAYREARSLNPRSEIFQ